MSRRAWTWLVLLSAIWGASYMLIKIGIRDLSPGMVAWTRIALAAAILLVVANTRGALRGFGEKWRPLAFLGAVQVAGPLLLIAAGEQEVSSSLAGVLVCAAPLFTALLAIRFDHEERSEGASLAGIVLGLVGVGLLLGVDLSGSGNELLGGLAILLAALGYAVGGLVVKREFAGASQIGVAAWVMLASTVLLLPALVIGFPTEAPGIGPLAAVIALGLVGTGIAWAIFYSLVARIGPARALLVTYLAPAFAVVYGATLLDETVTASTIGGLVLILVGSYLAAEGRLPLQRRVQTAPTPSDGGGGEPRIAESNP